jgi:hypothetical protein
MSSLREYLRIRLRERIAEANRLDQNISKQNSFETVANKDTRNIPRKRAREEPKECDPVVEVRSICSTL